MIIFKRATVLALVLGFSSVANAGLIDLTGNINIDGFNPFFPNDGDSDGTTFGLHLTILGDGSLLLDPAPIASLSGTASIGGIPVPPVGSPFIALLNTALGALPAAAFGTTFEFGSVGAGAGFPTHTQSVSNIPLSFSLPGLPSISTVFDSITLEANGNTLDVLFDEAGSGFGGPLSSLFFIADTGALSGLGITPGTPNNGSISSTFDINVTTAPVPVPAAVWLLGSSLVGLFGFSRRKVSTA